MTKKLMICALAVLALALAACGSDSDDSKSADATSGGADSSGIAEAQANVESLQKLTGLEYPKPPEEPYDPGTGKIAVIACGTAGAGCLGMAEHAVEAVKAAGWTPSEILDGEFTPQVQSGLIQKAVQQKYDGIIMVAMNPSVLKSAIDEAAAQDIPVACVDCVPDPEMEGKVIDVTPGGGIPEGEAIGNYIVANAEEGDKILQFVDRSFPIVVGRVDGVRGVIEDLCPECEYSEEEFATASLTQPGPPFFTAALSANPKGDLDWVAVPSDSFAIPMIPTALEQGRDEIRMTGTDSEQPFLESLSKGELAEADTYSQFPYMSWAAVEELIRVNAGLEPWDATTIPVSLVTEDNVDEFLKAAPEYYEPPDFDFRAMFEELWSGGSN